MRDWNKKRQDDLRRKIRSVGKYPAFKSGFKDPLRDEFSDENKAVEGSDLVGEDGPTLVDLPRGKSAGEGKDILAERIRELRALVVDLGAHPSYPRREVRDTVIESEATQNLSIRSELRSLRCELRELRHETGSLHKYLQRKISGLINATHDVQ